MSHAEQPRATLDVSVVIPVYDAASTLPDCLRSLRCQTLSADRYEIVVVDNNSRDGSAAVARLHPDVLLVEERRQGAYAARNRGVSVTRGRAIAFTDPDCVPARDWLENVLAALAGETVVAVGETLPMRASSALELLSTYARVKDEYVFGGSDLALYYGRTNNMAVLRSVFDTVGPFVEQQRGADVMFVRAVVERYGPLQVRFFAGMQVVHSEVQGLRSYLRKMHIYGYAHHSYRGTAAIRTLTPSERARLLLSATRQAAGLVALPTLLLLTGVAHTSWLLGRWRASAHLRPPIGVAPARDHPKA